MRLTDEQADKVWRVALWAGTIISLAASLVIFNIPT